MCVFGKEEMYKKLKIKTLHYSFLQKYWIAQFYLIHLGIPLTVLISSGQNNYSTSQSSMPHVGGKIWNAFDQKMLQ